MTTPNRRYVGAGPWTNSAGPVPTAEDRESANRHMLDLATEALRRHRRVNGRCPYCGTEECEPYIKASQLLDDAQREAGSGPGE